MTTTTDEGEEGEVAAVEGGMPCGDIFVNVARHTGESGAWDDEFDSYDARLCEYARWCDGEDASMILLPFQGSPKCQFYGRVGHVLLL